MTIKLNPQVAETVGEVFGLGPDHVHNPRYFGPRAGIRCLHCNTPIEPDPRVAATAAAPAPNTAATLAAVAARGERCGNCGHWTFRDAVPPAPGRPTVAGQCRNCTDRIVNSAGEPMLIRITGMGLTSARFLGKSTGTGEL